MATVLPPPPPKPKSNGLVEEGGNEFGLTQWEYDRIQEDIEEQIRKSQPFKPSKLKPTKYKHLTEKDRARCLVWLRSKARAATPEAKEKFRQLVDMGEDDYLR